MAGAEEWGGKVGQGDMPPWDLGGRRCWDNQNKEEREDVGKIGRTALRAAIELRG